MTEADRQRQADEDLRQVLSTAQGRRFLWSIIDGKAGLTTSPSFAGESSHWTAYREGRRSMGVELLAEAQRCSPSDAVHMLSEAVARNTEQRTKRELELKQEQDDADR